MVKQSAIEKRRLPDFVRSNSTWGNGELAIESCWPFDLIALGTIELKQKKAAGVGSDGLYQFEYSWVAAFRTVMVTLGEKIQSLLQRFNEI